MTVEIIHIPVTRLAKRYRTSDGAVFHTMALAEGHMKRARRAALTGAPGLPRERALATLRWLASLEGDEPDPRAVASHYGAMDYKSFGVQATHILGAQWLRDLGGILTPHQLAKLLFAHRGKILPRLAELDEDSS